MKRIIYTRPDGGVSIVTPAISKDDPPGFTEQDALNRALSKDIPKDAINPTTINLADIPQDRSFRNAWQHGGNAIVHDMNKCRVIHRDRMRVDREPKLAALDTEYQRADELGDTAKKTAVAAQKKTLRDAPADPKIDAAQTVDQLKAIGLPA